MIELLRKDYRLYRPIFIAAAILLVCTTVVPFLIGMLMLLVVFGWYALVAQGLTICLMVAFLKKYVGIYRAVSIAALSVALIYLAPLIIALLIDSNANRFFSPDPLNDLAKTGQACTILLAAAFGGCAFAIERRDRSAEFLAMIPVSRFHIVASKIFMSAAAIFPLWIVQSTFVYLTGNGPIGPVADEPSTVRDLVFWAYIFPAALILLVFGVSWLFSTLTKSPAISACLGLATILFILIAREQMLVPVLMLVARDHMNTLYLVRPDVDVLIAACAVPIGSLCFLAGTIIFTQRVSP